MVTHLKTEELYVIVNGVTAEVHGIYLDKEVCKSDCDTMNTLGVYAVLTLQQHLDALMTWFNRGLKDYE